MTRLLLVILLLAQVVPSPASADIYGEQEASAEPERVPRWDPDQEALRSLVWPGWSQHRQGEGGRGWAFTIVAGVTFVYMIGLYDVPVIGNEKDNFGQVFASVLYGMNAVLSAFDAHNMATESNREHGWDLGYGARKPDFGLRVDLVRLGF
jgi:hypothetical protein